MKKCFQKSLFSIYIEIWKCWTMVQLNQDLASPQTPKLTGIDMNKVFQLIIRTFTYFTVWLFHVVLQAETTHSYYDSDALHIICASHVSWNNVLKKKTKISLSKINRRLDWMCWVSTSVCSLLAWTVGNCSPRRLP